jgi:hypothetical protein
MKTFEYLLLDTLSGFLSGIDYQELTNRLNQLGSQGWEVVSVIDNVFTDDRSRGLLVTLKRERLG